MLKICVLASGSSGNSIYVASDSTEILIDAGLSGRQIEARLGIIGRALDGIDALLISHEHADHVKGLDFIEKRTSIPVYLNSATSKALEEKNPELRLSRARIFTDNSSFTIGDITVTPFEVLHDAEGPVGFAVSREEVKIAIATDLGHPTHLVKAVMKDSHAIVIETNHDQDVLRDHSRPEWLKQRIKSKQGHLSNDSAASLIEEVATEKLQAVFLAHISSDCNTPRRAHDKISESLARRGLSNTPVIVSFPDRPTDVIEITTERSIKPPGIRERQLFLEIGAEETVE